MIDYQQELENRGLDPHHSGENFIMMCCPFHDDNNPSFSVSLKDGNFRCFGCHEKGTFAELIAELDDISIDDALRKIKSSTHVEDIISIIHKALDDDEDEPIQYFNEKSFHKVYPPVRGTPGMDYLMGDDRKLTEEIILRFDCRWGADDKYRDRVVVPIRMPSGRILTYVGRAIYRGVKPKTRKARSPQRTLFGIYEMLQRFSKRPRYVILVEGEFDAMYLQQFGVPALSVMGSNALSSYQRIIVRKLRATVVLAYDSDVAGDFAVFGGYTKTGKQKIGELRGLNKVVPTIAVELPEGKDPNQLSESEINKIFGNFV